MNRMRISHVQLPINALRYCTNTMTLPNKSLCGFTAYIISSILGDDYTMEKENARIKQTIDFLTQGPCPPFEKLNCPKCHKEAIVISFPHAEWVDWPRPARKNPKSKRLRFELLCLYCGFEISNPEDLLKYGIEPEIDI